MPLFNVKKNEPEPFSAPPEQGQQGGSLSDQIMLYRQQGFSDEQIVQQLQNQGYNPAEIYDVLNGNVQGQQDMQMPQQDPYMQQQQMPPPPQQNYGGDMPREKIEEVAEAIINERWHDLLKDINQINEWKEKVDVQISKMSQEIKDVKESFDALHKGMLGKVTEYDQNITKVGTGIKAMEMTFQKILPTLTDSVNRLSGLADRASQKKVIAKPQPLRK